MSFNALLYADLSGSHEVFLAAQATAMAADTIVLAVTWYRTYHIVQLSRTIRLSDSRPILSVLLCDGGTNTFLDA